MVDRGEKISLVENLLNWINHLTRVIVSVFLLSSVLVIFWQVFTRYVLGSSSAWTEEFARYSSVWITFLGVALISRTREHIRLDFLDYLLGNAGKYVLLVIDTVFSVTFLAILGYQGAKILPIVNRQLAPGLRISLMYVYAAIPVGCLFAVVFAVEHLIRHTRRKQEGRE